MRLKMEAKEAKWQSFDTLFERSLFHKLYLPKKLPPNPGGLGGSEEKLYVSSRENTVCFKRMLSSRRVVSL